MTTGIVQDQNMEKQIEKHMGCMTGFLQLFDRHQILTGKRLYTTKRLPPSTSVETTTSPEKSTVSPAISKDLEKPQKSIPMTPPSPERFKPSPAKEMQSPAAEITTPAKLPLTLPILELKEGTRSSWKFSKEAPRLSLDSRATVDAKGSLYPREIRTNAAVLSGNRCESSGDASAGDGDDQQRRSPSVIARLMGIEQLPHSNPELMKKAELRRSASESRVSRDLFQYRFIDGNNFHLKQPSSAVGDNAGTEDLPTALNVSPVHPMDCSSRNANSVPPRALHRGVSGSPWKSPQQRKSFFDSEDFFPEPKQTVSIYGEIERRLKMRGIDEPTKDLETLKQILEALQLKGLLHSKKPSEQISRRNFVYDRSLPLDESSIVLIRPSRSPVSPINRRIGNESPPSSFRSRAGVRRNLNLAGENISTMSPKRERPDNDRNARNQPKTRNLSSVARGESNAKGPSSLARRKPLTVETQKKANDSLEQRRFSQVHSPKLGSRKSGSDQSNATPSPRNRKPAAEIYPKEKIAVVMEDESSTISEGSAGTSSQTDTERPKIDDYREGRSLLERCDKLLHSIAEITATELQPSPVSVLDSSFYKDESPSPSPVMKRSVDFRDGLGELEEEIWSSEISPMQSKFHRKSDDLDLVYISEIIHAIDYFPEDADIFLLVERQRYDVKGKNTSRVCRLQRRLIFDIINEILERNRQSPPWKVFSGSNFGTGKPSLHQIWSEFQKIREKEAAEDLSEIISGVLRKDLAGDVADGWGEWPVEMSEAVLDIERLIFKDLVSETIREVAAYGGKSLVSAPRRKLVF